MIRRTDGSDQRGAILPLIAGSLLVIMGMAAFAIDLGWLYYRSLETRKAAEAAALAGAIHLPLPTGVTLSGSIAEDVALATALEHGYTNTSVSVSYADTEAQLRVDVSETADTFFMQVFGIDQVDVARYAIAESLPPLKLGSDDPWLGSDPTSGRNDHFWVAINGDRRKKQDGDPFSTACYAGDGCNPGGDPNEEYAGDPAYYYGVEVTSAEVGTSLQFQVYDGPHFVRQPLDDSQPGDRSQANQTELTFRVMEPDESPGTWTDNSDLVCSYTFDAASDPTDPGVNEWTNVCADSAIKGIYVVQVTIGGSGSANQRDSITDFSLRALVNGSASSNVSVFGMGAMSLDMIEAGVAPTFQLAKLLPIYAGTELIVSLFDAGDATGGSANLRFLGSLAGIDCTYRVRGGSDGETLIRNWGTDDGEANCYVDTSGQRFNNQWVDFRLSIPPSFTCDPALPSGSSGSCWVMVDYNFDSGASVTERTTWAVGINGQPVHLLPGG